MTTGDRLKRRRKELGLSQQDLAAKTGIAQSTISDLERGESASSTSVATLAATLGVSALWLETGKGNAEIAPGENADVLNQVIALITLFSQSNPAGRAIILDTARFADKS